MVSWVNLTTPGNLHRPPYLVRPEVFRVQNVWLQLFSGSTDGCDARGTETLFYLQPCYMGRPVLPVRPDGKPTTRKSTMSTNFPEAPPSPPASRSRSFEWLVIILLFFCFHSSVYFCSRARGTRNLPCRRAVGVDKPALTAFARRPIKAQ